MKLKMIANIGNYQSITIESSEHDNIEYCKAELKKGFLSFNMPATTDFVKVWLRGD